MNFFEWGNPVANIVPVIKPGMETYLQAYYMDMEVHIVGAK